MRILLVNDYGEEIGGTETHLKLLKKYLSKNHEVKVFSSSNLNNQTSFSDYTFSKINKKSFTRSFKYIFNFKSYFALKRVIYSFKPDLVHFHNIFYECSPSVLLAGKKIPKIMTIHDYAMICPLCTKIKPNKNACYNKFGIKCIKCIGVKFFYEFLKRKIHQIFLSKINHFITLSKYMKKEVRKNFSEIKINNLSCGLELFDYYPIKNYETLLYIGRLSPEKGVDFLIKSFSKISNKFNNIKLIIIGEGSEKKSLESLTKRLNLSEKINFLGKVNHSKIINFYKNSTLIIVPSIWPEPFGLIGPEAMSVGRPLIATNLGGIPEWLMDKKTGYLVKPKDINSLAGKIIKLLSNKEIINKMGIEGRKKAINSFSIKIYVKKIETIYNLYLKKNK
jgi:glycosyltransferase involved in cell wall biosynthesis